MYSKKNFNQSVTVDFISILYIPLIFNELDFSFLLFLSLLPLVGLYLGFDRVGFDHEWKMIAV